MTTEEENPLAARAVAVAESLKAELDEAHNLLAEVAVTIRAAGEKIEALRTERDSYRYKMLALAWMSVLFGLLALFRITGDG